jgi:DNA-directed RNA polymerase subunit RPC12/RpoP
MSTVKCPSCGQRGTTEAGGDAAFADLGEWQGEPAFKCRRCGSGMLLRTGRLGTKATRLDAADLSDLESRRVA